MPSIVVSELEYAPPGGESLFFDVSFTVGSGDRAALVGANGTGKSTLLRILCGELSADDGEFAIDGSFRSMPQDAGMSNPEAPLRDLLLTIEAPLVRQAGAAMAYAEAAMIAGDDDGSAYAEALTHWGDVGGYEIEAGWYAAADRSIKTPIQDVSTRLVGELSGGERKRLLLDILLNSGSDVLILDEPDNYLDIPTRRWLEQQLADSRSTILMVSHDRELLKVATNKIIALEGSGCWVHGGSYETFPEARQLRQERLGDDLARWEAEERRLYRHMKIMKQRAAANFKNATKANAAETRWKRFVDAGPPPPPAPDQHIHVKLRGADAARRVIRLDEVGIDGLFYPFSDEIYHGERVGLIGPNGTGKSHLMSAITGASAPDDGTVAFGPRTSVGLFTQINDRPDFVGRTPLDIVIERITNFERAMSSLARYGLRSTTKQPFETLSGGQKARLEVLCLELEGHNVLLLDEPTDNLDVDSSEALERALDGFEGTVLAVSHDRSFLATLDRFLMIGDDGDVLAIPEFDIAMACLERPEQASKIKLVKKLT